MFFFFKQKTAYEMRISDWSSDVCSSDLAAHRGPPEQGGRPMAATTLTAGPAVTQPTSSLRRTTLVSGLAGAAITTVAAAAADAKIGRASCRERVCPYV